MRIFFAISFALLFLFTLLHFPIVQQAITQRVINQVTKNINADIRIDKTHFSFNSGLVFEDIVLSTEKEGDSLLVVNRIKISPRSTLLGLLRGIEFNDLEISKVTLYLIRGGEDDKLNWAKIALPSKSESDNPRPATAFDIKSLNIDQFYLVYRDENRCEYVDASLKRLNLLVKNVDLANMRFDIKRLTLTSPDVLFVKSEYNTRGEPRKDSLDRTDVFPSIAVGQIGIIDGKVTIVDNNVRTEYDDINLLLSSLVFNSPQDISLALENLSVKSKDFNVDLISSRQIRLNQDTLIIKDAIANIGNSRLHFDLDWFGGMGTPSLSTMHGRLSLNHANIRLSDLIPLLPQLESSLKGQAIASTPIQLRGKLMLEPREMHWRNVDLWIARKHHFNGSGSIVFDADRFNQSLLNIQVDRLSSNLVELNKLYSGINIPRELLRMGNVDFSGSFDGFINDFVADGSLDSDLGHAEIDIQFNLSGSESEALRYSGSVYLDSFDLSRMTLSEDFGWAKAAISIKDGIGPNFDESRAVIEANIDYLQFRDYTYSNATFNGSLSSRVVDGAFKIKQEALDFSFIGKVDFSTDEHIYDFYIEANNINLCDLNLSAFPCALRFIGYIDLRGNILSDVLGSVSFKDVQVVHDSSEIKMKYLEFHSYKSRAGKSMTVSSDYFNMDFHGYYNLARMFPQMYDQFLNNERYHAELWGLKWNDENMLPQDFTFNIELSDIDPILEYIGSDVSLAQGAKISGEYKSRDSLLFMRAVADELKVGTVALDNVALFFTTARDFTSLTADVAKLSAPNLSLSDVKFGTRVNDDQILWEVGYFNSLNNHLDIQASSRIHRNGYHTEIIKDDIIIDSIKWSINAPEGVGVYPKRLYIPLLEITDAQHAIAIRDVDGRGLLVDIKNIELSLINPLINYDKLYFSGNVNSLFEFSDIFENNRVKGFFEVDDFLINGDSFGTLSMVANQEGEDKVLVDLLIDKDEQRLIVKATYDLPAEEIDASINIQEYPMSFFEYIITDGLSEVEGTTDVGVKIFGKLDDLKMRGTGTVKNAGIKIDYLGAYYRISNNSVNITEKFIDFSKVELIDERDNRARIRGGLRHNLLADIRADLTISSPEFIALNTTNLDNPMYYGLGNGRMEIGFEGKFDAINIRVDAQAGRLSRLYIPLGSNTSTFEESFIKFDYNKEVRDSVNITQLVGRLQESGVDFEMNLEFTPEAEVQVIYDPVTNNVLVGRGSGDLRIRIKRDGEFTVYGQYNVTSGRYLYTGYGLIAKPFEINAGGTVIWTGDPINATIEVTAQYPGLRAPLQSLLVEYIQSSSLPTNAFSQRHDIDLTLLLSGTLFTPTINFNIDFPNVTGELKAIADSKIRTLKATENGINNQVVGLLVFRNFLPDNNPFANISGGTVGQTGNNTITEFLTNQLSLLMSDYLSDKLKDSDFITGIDFEVALAQNTRLLGSDNPSLLTGLFDVIPDEVQVNMRNRFKNENFVLNVGGNYVRENQIGTARNYMTGNFALDWFITENRRLKIRFYGNYDYNEVQAQHVQRYGFGLNYSREFGKLSNLMNVIDEIIEEAQTTPQAVSNVQE